MRDYAQEENLRIAFIRERMAAAGASGLVFGASGGKDCALTGILCRRACADTLAVLMPCVSKRNYGEDTDHARLLCEQFDIPLVTVDLTQTRETLRVIIESAVTKPLAPPVLQNIAPRLRMTSLYALAQNRNALVVGTGNRCEIHMGYFTKWGDGACDINPIADLTVSEIYSFLRYLGAPSEIIDKPPSAGLFDGQTDEGDMGVAYGDIERALAGEPVPQDTARRIERAHNITAHKRRMPYRYGEK